MKQGAITRMTDGAEVEVCLVGGLEAGEEAEVAAAAATATTADADTIITTDWKMTDYPMIGALKGLTIVRLGR